MVKIEREKLVLYFTPVMKEIPYQEFSIRTVKLCQVLLSY